MRSVIRASYRYGLAVVLAAGVLATQSQAADSLQWKFKEGDTAQYAMSVTNDMLADFGGAEFEILFKLIFDLSWKVNSVDADGVADLSQTIDRIQLHMSTPFTGEFGYDSNEDVTPEGPIWERMGGPIEAMREGEFKIKVGPNGDVREVTLPEALTTTLAEQAEAGGGGGGMAMLAGGGMFSENSIKQVVGQTIVTLPSGDVAPGTEWTKSFENKMGDTATERVEMTFRYEGDEDREGTKLSKIAATSETSLELNEEADLDLFMELTEQEGSGTILFDAASGRAVESKFSQKATIEGDFMGNEFAQERETTTLIIQGTSDQLPQDESTAPAADAPADDAPADAPADDEAPADEAADESDK